MGRHTLLLLLLLQPTDIIASYKHISAPLNHNVTIYLWAQHNLFSTTTEPQRLSTILSTTTTTSNTLRHTATSPGAIMSLNTHMHQGFGKWHTGTRRKREQRRKWKRVKGRKRKIITEEYKLRGKRKLKDLSLWIDHNQVRMISGYSMEVFVILNGLVLPYVLDPNFEKQLPIIPAQVESVNFTWYSGGKDFHYHFTHLHSDSSQPEVILMPALSIPTHGTVPHNPTVFSVDIRCADNLTGALPFSIGLAIHNSDLTPLPGTPLKLTLRKECQKQGPDPECNQKCQNGGVCDDNQRCQCPEGYMGQYCSTALCYPHCLNGGICRTPGYCSCPPGFQGRHCEGGICQNKCMNGGKCVQKDRCKCRQGFFGNTCQYSQCFVACINGGRCRGVNKCRCPAGFGGDHCEVILPLLHRRNNASNRCRRRCRNGECQGSRCQCYDGYTGRWCRRRVGDGSLRQRVWVR